MEKTILEKRIEEKATERAQKDYIEMMKFLKTNPITSRLTIEVKCLKEDKMIHLAYHGPNWALLNDEGLKNQHSTSTNIETVLDELVEKYKKEETDSILSKLENLGYLFNQ